MGRIKGKNTKPEMRLRRALWSRGLRYRIHGATPVGRPDLVFPGPAVAVFVDGCFWHGCPDHYVRPRSQPAFWADKLRTNIERDRRQTLQLEEVGWKVCRVWEHEIDTSLGETADRIEALVRGTRVPAGPSWRVVEVQSLDAAGDHERRIMEQLRDPGQTRVRAQKRSTAKWDRPDSSS